MFAALGADAGDVLFVEVAVTAANLPLKDERRLHSSLVEAEIHAENPALRLHRLEG